MQKVFYNGGAVFLCMKRNFLLPNGWPTRRADAFYACAPAADGREVDAQTVADIAARDCAAVQACASVGDALDRAVSAAAPQDCVLVCGSLFLIGEVEKILRPRQKTAE